MGSVLLGVGLAALIGLVLLVSSLSSHWRGEIVDLREESYRVKRGQRWYTERRTVAIIREPNGNTRKVNAGHGWRTGDRLEKRRGETAVRGRPCSGGS